jgi:hypothetical protein
MTRPCASCRCRSSSFPGTPNNTRQGRRPPTGALIGVSMRRHILSRANVVASERQLDQPKPLRAPFLFALRLRAIRRWLGARWDPSGAALPFEPRPPMESGGHHTPNIRSRLRTVSVGRARLISLLPLSERACPSALSVLVAHRPPSGSSLASRAAGIVERIVDLRRNP